MGEQLRETYQTPWDMPEDIFWAIDEAAELRRAQWVIDNCPDVTLEDLTHRMPIRDDTRAQLKLLRIVEE